MKLLSRFRRTLLLIPLLMILTAAVVAVVSFWRGHTSWVNPINPDWGSRVATSKFVLAIAYSPDGRSFATANGNSVTIWDRTTRTVTRTVGNHTEPVYAVAYSKDGRWLASVSCDGNLILWDTENGWRKTPLQAGEKGVGKLYVAAGEVHPPRSASSVCFSPDGRTVAVGHYYSSYPHGVPGEVRMWDVQTGERTHVLQGHTAGVMAIAFSPDGKLLASGDAAGYVKVWDATTGAHVKDVGDRDSPEIKALAFAPGTGILAYGGGWYSRVGLWDSHSPAEGPRQMQAGVPFGALTCMAFAPDGRTLAVGWFPHGGDPRITLSDITTQTHPRTLWCPHTIRSIAFAPDGTELAAGCEGSAGSGEIRFWAVSARPEAGK